MDSISKQDVDAVKAIKIEEAKKRAIRAGQIVATPEPGEEVVIAGMSGRFPDADNVREYMENLMNKVDMVSCDNRRWEPTHPEIPQRTGKINHITKFDGGFFGTHFRQNQTMDPMCRMLLERTAEAIFDAGVHPSELENTRTGVFVGSCYAETEKAWFYERLHKEHFAVTGVSRSMYPNRISYFLKLKGPSFITDTACSSSLYALELAYRSIRQGKCDNAIVGGTNLCLHPYVSLQFARLGVLGMDGACKSFDDAGNGYARSEAICVIFLQKAKNARRIYSEIVHAKVNCDGYKPQGITFPNSELQRTLFEEFYQECKVNPNDLTFMEAHGTGTKVGDPEEVNAIDAVFCKTRKTPLPIGSVKSNIGHTEPSSGLCSVIKCLVGLESGYIPPNIHYNKPRAGIEPLEKGRMVVIAEKTKWPKDDCLVGVNSFGFGGGNCHVLLKSWNKKKINDGLPGDDLPRLLCCSGRVQEAVESIFNEVSSKKLDAEYVRLLQEIFNKNIPSHTWRGYSILSKTGELLRSVQKTREETLIFHLLFGFKKEHLGKVAKDLLMLPLFVATVQRIHNVLLPRGLNITDLIMKNGKGDPKNISYNLLLSATLQIFIVDLLKVLELKPQVHAVFSGEFVKAYYEGQLTLEQTVLSLYHLAKVIKDVEYERVQLKKKELLSQLKTLMSDANADYFTKRLFNPDQFETTINKTKSVVVEVGSALLQNVRQDSTQILFPENAKTNGITLLLELLGKIYQSGYEMPLDRLYPKVQFPVSRGTPMLSPIIRWEHTTDWFVAFYSPLEEMKSGERAVTITMAKDNDWSFLQGHMIDGRNLFPATGYLNFVWETQSMIDGMLMSEMQIVFEDVKFHRATTLTMDKRLELIVMVQRVSGRFEVIEGGAAVVSGYIKTPQDMKKETVAIPIPPDAEDQLEMDEKDIYKELKLRGYHYSGLFRGLRKANIGGTKGLVEWNGNWIAFMDNMLQMQILAVDTRNLYVPTVIKRLVVDAKKHIGYTKQFGDEKPNIPVYVNKEARIIKSGAIEISGLEARSIPRKKPLGEPVLEKHVFVPNVANLTLEESIRVVMQIILENNYTVKTKSLEIRDNEDTTEVLSGLILSALGDQPLIQPEVTVYSNQKLEIPNVTVEDKKLVGESDVHVVISSNVLTKALRLQQLVAAIKENSYILSRENTDFVCESYENLEVILRHFIAATNEQLILLKKKSQQEQKLTTVEIKQDDFSWITTLKEAIKTGQKILLYTQNQPTNGIMGLFNCLRREMGGGNIRCYFIQDEAPTFDTTNPFYSQQIEKDLALNVYQKGKWGTYRHLSIKDDPYAEREHAYVNVLTRGDLSSLKWVEGPLRFDSIMPPEKTLVHVYSTSVNFRDVMTASGKISADVVTMDRLIQDCVQGFEFAGKTKDGKRVMGMITAKAFSNLAIAETHVMYEMPDFWKMEEAVTIPVVYGTVYYALFMRIRIQKGQSVLIHAGSGGVGQAAIRVALYHGCTVFTTVGTKEKREFLLKEFPELKDSHIGNSRDTSFEQMIFRETKGRGVDAVLNSLAEEKLQASLRCLKKGGAFLEIGKFDLASDSPLYLELLKREISFHGIMLDQFMESVISVKQKLKELVIEGIKSGAVKPLPTTAFKENEIEEAFRFMAGGKHIGKVVFNVREEDGEINAKPNRKTMNGLGRYLCESDETYVITGGLGGFGLELADWLILRGARKLVLTSRTGIKNGYQALRIKTWRSYGVTIKISTEDISTEEGCEKLLKNAEKLGTVRGIFHLAVVLKDGIFENQTEETFIDSIKPKSEAAAHLDKLSREICTKLRDFVIFSSVSCGRGNAGQTNYGMANSVMERICEQRKNEGLPALAIQWGAIGEVGLVAEMQKDYSDLKIGGTLQQRISSCLEVLDVLLKQNNYAIVSSMVVAEKQTTDVADNVVDCVANILGIKNIKTVPLNQTLAELGMDSMTAVEIKQSLEREFEVFLTANDIRNLTFGRLLEIKHEQENAQDSKKHLVIDKDNLPDNIRILLRCVGDEELAKIPLVHMKSALPDELSTKTPKLFLIPGVEGMSSVLEPLVVNLQADCYCLQFTYDSADDTITDLAEFIFNVMSKEITKTEPYNLLAYSFGCVVALELIAILEREGYTGRLIFLDGAPEMLIGLTKLALNDQNSAEFETNLILALLTLYMPVEQLIQYREAILNCANYDERLDIALATVPKESPHSPIYQRQVAIGMYKRLSALVNYKPTFEKLQSTIELWRPEVASIQNIAEDYKLSELTENPVSVRFFKGNHLTVLENLDLARAIMDALGCVIQENGEDVPADDKVGVFENNLLNEKYEIVQEV